MRYDLQEQACWLLLTFESGLSTRIINDILVAWCRQRGRTLSDFFASDPSEWEEACQLNAEIIEKLEKAKEKLVGQAFLVEQLEQGSIHVLPALDDDYPALLKQALKRNATPPVLFYAGDLDILARRTIAVIGSRTASEQGLAFTHAVVHYLAEHGANVISGNARGVDRVAYEAAMGTEGCTTVILPHGIRKLSSVQMRDLQPKIEEGRVLVMSKFHPDAGWLVSRAMERNKVVTGLAQLVIVAESDTKGGTWEGANSALKQKRPLYVRQTTSSPAIPGNDALMKLGGQPLPWPTKDSEEQFAPLLAESAMQQQKQSEQPTRTEQFSLFAMEE